MFLAADSTCVVSWSIFGYSKNVDRSCGLWAKFFMDAENDTIGIITIKFQTEVLCMYYEIWRFFACCLLLRAVEEIAASPQENL